MTLLRLILTCCLLGNYYTIAETDGPLKFPKVLSNPDGKDLRINLSLQEADHQTYAATVFHTRLLDGTLPGPTLRVKKGDTLYVDFKNELTYQEGTVEEPNTFSYPDSTNLHFHGAHVSGEAPADDTSLIIDPGESYNYEVPFPETHMGGTHWYHPHRHGAGFIQVGGGAAGVLIVEDAPGEVPPEVADAEEIILMAQNFREGIAYFAREDAGDQLLKYSYRRNSTVQDHTMYVNGQYLPTLKMTVGKWQRWRVVFGGWDRPNLDLQLVGDDSSNCEMHLLAKDGIYIEDYPRTLEKYPIPVGGRADIMVRCNEPGFQQANSYLGPLFFVNVKEPKDDETVEDVELTTDFQFPRSDYLKDLLDVDPDPDCSCPSNFESGNVINGLKYEPGNFLHTVALGSVVERTIYGTHKHPYHQHVYPFQLIDFGQDLGDDATRDYFQIGDYHDSLFTPFNNETVIRYLPEEFLGRMAVHCHRMSHSDQGMLTAEDVVDPANGGTCTCSPRFNATRITRAPTRAPIDNPVSSSDSFDEINENTASDTSSQSDSENNDGTFENDPILTSRPSLRPTSIPTNVDTENPIQGSIAIGDSTASPTQPSKTTIGDEQDTSYQLATSSTSSSGSSSTLWHLAILSLGMGTAVLQQLF